MNCDSGYKGLIVFPCNNGVEVRLQELVLIWDGQNFPLALKYYIWKEENECYSLVFPLILAGL